MGIERTRSLTTGRVSIKLFASCFTSTGFVNLDKLGSVYNSSFLNRKVGCYANCILCKLSLLLFVKHPGAI